MDHRSLTARWSCSPSMARAWWGIATICARRRARRPSSAGRRKNSARGCSRASRRESRSTRSAWPRSPPCPRSRRSRGARRSSCGAW